jgi:hypothetical protein
LSRFLENTFAVRFHPLPTEDDQQPYEIKMDIDMLPRTFLILLRESMEENNNVVTYASHMEGISELNRIVENNEEFPVEELNEHATKSLFLLK